MPDDIDLSKYVQVVFRHYKLGLILAVCVALVIVVSQWLQPATYTATTTLFASSPQYQWRFDSRVLPLVQTNKNWQKEFTEVAKDSWLKAEIEAALTERYGESSQGTVAVRAGKQTLVHVDATASTPESAMNLANRWSEEFIEWVDEMYGTAPLADAFSAELVDAENAYMEKVEAVRQYKADTGIGIASEGQTMLEGYEWLGPLGLELAEKNRILAEHTLAVENLEILDEQLQSAQAAGASLESLSWELLNVPAIQDRDQLHIEDVQALFDDAEQIAALIDAEMMAQNNVMATLQDVIADDQDQITQLATELDRLVEARILTKEIYQTIQRKVDEIAVQSEIEGPLLRVITEATLPTGPNRGDWLMIGLLAVVSGAVIGVSGCFVAEFVESRRPAA